MQVHIFPPQEWRTVRGANRPMGAALRRRVARGREVTLTVWTVSRQIWQAPIKDNGERYRTLLDDNPTSG